MPVPADSYEFLGRLVIHEQEKNGDGTLRMGLCKYCGCMVPVLYYTYHNARCPKT